MKNEFYLIKLNMFVRVNIVDINFKTGQITIIDRATGIESTVPASSICQLTVTDVGLIKT